MRSAGAQPRRASGRDEEVKAVVAEGVTTGAITPEEKEMISGVMRLADWRVQAMMTRLQSFGDCGAGGQR